MEQFYSARYIVALAALLLGLLALAETAQAQAPSWQTATSTPGTSITVKAMAALGGGDVVLVGFFANTATFGATTLTSTGTGNDGFVAKWNPTTGFVWAQAISGTNGEFVTAVAVNGSSIYVGGNFSGRMATIGSIFLGNADSMGNNDLFVARLTDRGSSSTVDWAMRAGGAGSEELTGLVWSGATIYMTGNFFGATTTLGSFTLSNATGTNGASNIFIAKLTDTGPSGAFGWALSAGSSTGGDQATALAVSGTSVYVAGSFQSSALRFGSLTLATSGGSDLFVTKLTDAGSTGSFGWALKAGGTAQEAANALAVNGAAVYLAGYFSSPTLTVGSRTLLSAGGFDVLVARLTDAGSSGSFDWAQAAGGPGDELARGLAVSGPHLLATGFTTSAVARFGSSSISSVGQHDVFLTKLVDAGSTSSFAWAQQAGGANFDQGDAVLVQGTRVVVAGGFLSPSISFGSTVPPLVRTGSGLGLFLATLADLTITATTASGSRLPCTLAPNPAHASTTVQLPPLPGASAATLTLLDALGRTVRTATVALPTAGLRHTFGLGGLAPGLYALRIGAGAATATQRLVVE